MSPALQSFVPVTADSHFPIQNLPYGIFSTRTSPIKRVGIAIGDQILDVAATARAGLLAGPELRGRGGVFEQDSLNAFMALGPAAWAEARAELTRLLSQEEPTLRDNQALRSTLLVPQADAQLHLPVRVGDYTDFYLSREHAVNVSKIFRGSGDLQPNWHRLPVGYHGRASSVVVSGTPVARPLGQLPPAPGSDAPRCAPSEALDYELEMAAVVGVGNALGSRLSTADAPSHVFGLLLLNDWSARDVQRWEYVPLGPFNGKNFASSVSPWVVTLAALAPFKCAAPPQEPRVLPYLQEPDRHTFDVHLEVSLRPAGGRIATTVTTSNLRHLYWTLPQMVAHHTLGGCNLAPGDLLGTGTISREGEGGQGCLLEATLGGKRPLRLSCGAERTCLQDGDTVVMTGWAQGEGFRVGFGECTGVVMPAQPL